MIRLARAVGVLLLIVVAAVASPVVAKERANADTQGIPHLEVDADPGNGARPCDPVDATRALVTSSTYTIAICLEEGAGAPDSFEIALIWTGGAAAPVDVLDDNTDGLNDNPDFNEATAPYGFGSNWSCTHIGFQWPTADWPATPGVPDAYISCNEKGFVPGTLTADPGLLATITMQATGAGTESFNFSLDGSSDFNSPEYSNHACGVDISCPGATVASNTDLDADAVLNWLDSCPTVSNGGQQNADNEIDNGPGIATADGSVPNAVADTEGDACETDGDADNDGLPDSQDTEPLGSTGICAAFAGASGSHPHPAGGDITNDDNANGTAAPPMGTDAADNGPSWDTDNDGVLDGVECQLGTNPRDRFSKPTVAQCGGTADADGDGLKAWTEKCRWGTSDSSADSDGDGVKDCVEANDTNGDGAQNSTDSSNSAAAANGTIGKTADFDLDGNGLVNFTGDSILSLQLVNHTNGVCT